MWPLSSLALDPFAPIIKASGVFTVVFELVTGEPPSETKAYEPLL
jgi:hypothetical protein